MKVTREQAQQNRQRVVETAGRMFRESGFDGVGIADVMKSVGLTHGGFYAQFPSKEHLMAEATGRASEERAKKWRDLLDQAPHKKLSTLTSQYLSTAHRDNPGMGCVVAALGIDTARQGPLVRSALTGSVSQMFDLLLQLLPGRSQKARRRKAIASFAAMVGGVVLARGVNDEALSEEILEAVRAHVTDMGDE